MDQVLAVLRLWGVDADRQNTGGVYTPTGQYVRYGAPGNSDLTGMIHNGPGRGRKLDIEVKRPGFDPTRVRSSDRDRWARQLARLRKTNANGGYGVWVSDPAQMVRVLEGINRGLRIAIDDDGWCYLTDEES